MGILDWWNKRGQVAGGQQSREQIAETVERVVQNTNPRLRFAGRYKKRLAPAVTQSINYAREIVAAIPAPHEASAAGWNSDHCMRAFFATADDIKQIFSRAPELRAYFDQNPASEKSFALLSMEMIERKILGMALEGDIMRRDVAQTTMSFGDYRVRFCQPTETDLREELQRRIVDQLALEGLARMANDRSHRDKLEKERALLKVRLRLLERQGVGMGGAAIADPAEVVRLQMQLAENTQNLDEAGSAPEILERELERIRDVLAEPARNFHISNQRLRLDRMNVILEDNNPQKGEEIEFTVGQTSGSKPQKRAFALVYFARNDLLPDRPRFKEAAPG
ncbi:MAG: hypothetical protein ACRESK_04000 [Gammaproteobacteria bacterium]